MSEPVLRVVNPDATPEEVAAILVVFASLGSTAAPPAKRSLWATPNLRTGLRAGPSAWRASGLIR